VIPDQTVYDWCTLMGTLPEATPHQPEYRLYDSGAVGAAAFFCCPLAGALLIAVNYRRLGKPVQAALAVALGLIATALYFLIKWDMKRSLGSIVFGILFFICAWICTWQAAKQEQGDAVKEHTARGGQLESTFTAGCVGFATLAALVLVAGAIVYVYEYRKIVIIGTKDLVIYSGLATKADATALGNWLKSDEYFQDRGASVLLNKGFGGTRVSFGVQEGFGYKPGMLSSFEELTRELAPIVGGLPIHVSLVNTGGNVEETSIVGKVRFGKLDGVYYEGSATKAEAQALGKRFELHGFFRGKEANMFLTKHDDGTTLAFVMAFDGAWNNPKAVSSLEAIVRDVAPTIGGLPINMRLLDTQLKVEKEELIEEGDKSGNDDDPGRGGETAEGLYHVGGGVAAPVPLNTVEAEYSDEARRAKYQGVCLIALIVDAQGNPQNPRVVRSLGMGLDERALDAVRKYRFKPAMKDGRIPVPVSITVEVNFRLY
jgi:TonB family protein